MATFIALQNEVLALVIDTPSAVQTYVPQYVNRAIRKLQNKHNYKVMEAEATRVTVAGVRTLDTARPTDWKEPRGNPYYIENFGSYRRMFWVSSKGNALARWGNDVTLDIGAPGALYEDDLPGEFNVFPYPDGLSDYPDGQYRITIPYWKYLSNLISDTDENWFTTNAEQYIVKRAVGDAFSANEDENRAQYWYGLAQEEYAEVLALDKSRRISETDTLVPHTGALPPHLQE